MNCGNPGSINNGYFSGYRFTFDNRVRYKCQKGYKLQGTDTLYCNEFGEWEGDRPQCIGRHSSCLSALLASSVLGVGVGGYVCVCVCVCWGVGVGVGVRVGVCSAWTG